MSAYLIYCKVEVSTNTNTSTYRLLARSGGSILFVSSVAGFRPFPGLAAYGVSKAALLQMTKVLSVELAADNVRVNAIAPGVIDTKFSKAVCTVTLHHI